jgi:polysaccharide pyruvyl transferase CsaB
VVKRTIAALLIDEDYARYIRENARACSLTWDKIAGDWVRHWDEVVKKKKRRRIVIGGYYGFKNLGDEAILSCMVKEITSVDPDIGITVVSNDPFETEKRQGVQAVPRDNFRLQTKEVEKADLVILGGGGLFQDHHRIKVSQFFEGHHHGIQSYASLPLMAKIYKKPLLYYANGIGPLFSRESFLFTEWACGLADFITVRDNYSYHFLTELLKIDRSKIALGYDSVLQAPVPSKQRGRSLSIFENLPGDKKLIIVAPRFWLNKALEDKVAGAIAESLNSFLKESHEYHVVLIPFHLWKEGENDLSLCERISGNLDHPSTMMKCYSSYEEIFSLYLSAEFSICMRYHSLILSAMAGTPMIAISYDKKDDAFMKEIGLENLGMPMKDAESKKIEECIQYVLSHSKQIKTGLMLSLREIREKRMQGNSILLNMIKDKP